MKRALLIIISIVILTACNSAFDDLTTEAQAALGKGDFTLALQLYKEALDEKKDDEVADIIQALEDYETLMEKVEANDWEAALQLANQLIDDENAPYALKKEVREQLTDIELALETLETDEEFTEKIERLEQLIADENVSAANELLTDLDIPELEVSQGAQVAKLKEQLINVEQKLEEAEREKRAQAQKEKEAEERKKAEKTSNLQDKYLQKAADVEVAVDKLEDEINPVGTTEIIEFSSGAYTMWDDLLNEIWGVLGEEMPKSNFEQLRKEQLEWIAEKEATADSIYDGSPNQGTAARVEAMYSKWDYTEERVYYLINNFMN